jgi:Cu2+-containing amine oxidase
VVGKRFRPDSGDGAAGAPSTKNADIVLWYYSALHHVIRDEDSDMTLVMFDGFHLMPFNIWSQTPFYP